MKRNLLIGTSLVAAVSATSLDARSFSVMTEEARKDNTALSSAIHVVTEGYKKFTGITALSAGTTDAFAEAYKAVAAQVAAGKDGKVTLAAITAALAKNPELRNLVAEFRTQVAAQVAAEKKAATAKVAQSSQAVQPAHVTTEGQQANVDPKVNVETHTEVKAFGALSEAVDNTKTALIVALTGEYNAETAVKGAVADVAAKTTEKADADKALEEKKTAAEKATADFDAATAAAEKATAALTALTEDKKAAEEKITAAEKAIADKRAASTAVTSAETDALAVLKAELSTIDAKIAAATTTQTDTAAKLAEAKAHAQATAEAVKHAIGDQTDAATALETAVKGKDAADADLTAKTTAVKTATEEFTAAKTAILESSEKAAKEAATNAKAATKAAKEAKTEKEELAAKAKAASNKVEELTARKANLKEELTAAKADGDAAEATATEDALVAIAAELAKAEIAATHAEEATEKAAEFAEEAATKAAIAATAKATTAAELETAKVAVKAADAAVKAAKTALAKTVNSAAAVAQAEKAEADKVDAVARVAKLEAELADLEAEFAKDQTNDALKQKIDAKKIELAEAKKTETDAKLAAENANKAAAQADKDLSDAENRAKQAQSDSASLMAQLEAAQKERAAALGENAALNAQRVDFARTIIDLITKVNPADAEEILANIILTAEAKFVTEDADDLTQDTINAARILQNLMVIKAVGGNKGTPSAVLAEIINVGIDEAKAEFVSSLNSKPTINAILDTIEIFKGLEANVKRFGALKEQLDSNNASGDIAALRTALTEFDFNTVKEAREFLAEATLYFSESFGETFVGGLAAQATEHLAKLSDAVDAVYSNIDSLMVKLGLAADKEAASSASSSVTDEEEKEEKEEATEDEDRHDDTSGRQVSGEPLAAPQAEGSNHPAAAPLSHPAAAPLSHRGSGEYSFQQPAASVQNLTAETMDNLTAETMDNLKAALTAFRTFLDTQVATSDFDQLLKTDTVTENRDLPGMFAGLFPLDSGTQKRSLVDNLKALQELTGLSLENLTQDTETYSAEINESNRCYDERIRTLRDQIAAENAKSTAGNTEALQAEIGRLSAELAEEYDKMCKAYNILRDLRDLLSNAREPQIGQGRDLLTEIEAAVTVILSPAPATQAVDQTGRSGGGKGQSTSTPLAQPSAPPAPFFPGSHFGSNAWGSNGAHYPLQPADSAQHNVGVGFQNGHPSAPLPSGVKQKQQPPAQQNGAADAAGSPERNFALQVGADAKRQREAVSTMNLDD